MNRLVPKVALLLVVGATGCELVAGIEDKVLIGNLADATAKDAPSPNGPDGVGPADGGGSEPLADADAGLTLEASPQDGAGAFDSGPMVAEFTAPDAGSADPSAPCAAQPPFLFCDDFDMETTLLPKWEYDLVTDDGGTLGFFAGPYTSPPRSLLVFAPATWGAPQVTLGTSVGTLSTRFRLAFDLRIDMDRLTDVPVTAITQITGQRQGKIMQLNLTLQPGGQGQLESSLSLDGGAARRMALPSLPLRKWTRLVIAYDAIAGIAVLEDGQVIGSDPTATGGAPQSTQFLMGMVYQIAPGTEAVRFEIDNVVFRGL